jgi:hypothetical protein
MSGLLRLPAELRIQIWEYAMNCAYIDITTVDWVDDSLQGTPRNERDRKTPEVALRLLETSRQIYAETHLLIFDLATFRIPCEFQLRAISKHAMLHNIRSIQSCDKLMSEVFFNLQPIKNTTSYEQCQTQSRFFTIFLPLLGHVEFRSFAIENLYLLDPRTPKDNKSLTKERAEFYRKLLEQRTREREDRPWLTFCL